MARIFNDYFVNIYTPIDLDCSNSGYFESHPSILSIKNFMNSARSSQGPHDIHARLLTIHLPLTRSQVSSMVSVIIESFETSKSPGFDNINALAVKLTSKAIVAPLTELIHACIRKGALLCRWRGSLPRLHQFSDVISLRIKETRGTSVHV